MQKNNTAIGNFKTLGDISKIYLNSLGLSVDKNFNRLCVEKECDLENFKIELNNYLDNLILPGEESKFILFKDKKYKLSSSLVAILKNSFLEFIDLYISTVREVTIFTTQNNLNRQIAKAIFIPFIDMVTRNIYFHYKDKLYIYDIKITEYYSQIKENILKILNKENFSFLIENNNSINTSYKDYRMILDLGNNFHSNESINEIINSILAYENINCKVIRENLELSLFLARFHHEFTREILKDTGLEKESKLSNISEKEVEDLFITLQNGEFTKEIPKLDLLKRKVDLRKEKNEKDREEFLKEYNAIKKEDIKLKWFLDHIYARYLVMNNESNKALKYYESALNLGKYSAGKFLNKIIKEGLVLSSYLNKKNSFKQFYKRAYLFNLVSAPLKDEDKWIIDHYRKDFNMKFPEKGFYNKIIKPQISQDSYSLYENDIIPNLNLKSPNLKYNFWNRKRTQLEIFASLPSFDNIELEKKYQNYMRQLIEAGADVNFINSTGETPLVGALCSKNHERALILLENSKIKNSINEISFRKKNTALSVLLNDLYIKGSDVKEILIKLIENGADVNQKADIEMISPIHLLLLNMSNLGLKDYHNISDEDIEKLRRLIHQPGISECYFDSQVLSNLEILKTPIGREIFEKINELNLKNRNLYLDLAKILLDNGADINVPIKNGITPFLYAMEIGDINLVKLFLNYNPDITKTCNIGNDVLTTSLGYNNFEVFKYLIDTFDFSNYKTHHIIQLCHSTFNLNYNININYDIAKKYLKYFIKKLNLSFDNKLYFNSIVDIFYNKSRGVK